MLFATPRPFALLAEFHLSFHLYDGDLEVSEYVASTTLTNGPIFVDLAGPVTQFKNVTLGGIIEQNKM